MKKLALVFLSLLLAGCATQTVPLHEARHHQRHRKTKPPTVEPSYGGMRLNASFYGGGPKRYEPNAHTANGELFNQWGMTAAHRTWPIGSRWRVCYEGCVVVRINDRGPAKWTGKSLDLSRGAAYAIGHPGTGKVSVTRVQ